MKRITVAIAVLCFCGVVAFAQPNTPPKPNPNSESTVTDIYGNSREVKTGPVGTATALLLSLGAGAVAYKVRKNKRIIGY